MVFFLHERRLVKSICGVIDKNSYVVHSKRQYPYVRNSCLVLTFLS